MAELCNIDIILCLVNVRKSKFYLGGSDVSVGESFPLYHPVAFYIMRARFQNNLSLTLCLRVRAKVL